MASYDGGCMGAGEPQTMQTYCICSCHTDPSLGCDDAVHCAPVSAKASDNVRLRHINRDPDRGKRDSKRGTRSLRRA